MVLVSSCSTKYNGLHIDKELFLVDVSDCLEKSCNKKETNKVNISFRESPILAYGGGGGGGGGMTNSYSFKIFNNCLNKKGYLRDKEGIFDLPPLSCK